MYNITMFLRDNLPNLSQIEKLDLLAQSVVLKQLDEDENLPKEAKLSFIVKQVYAIEDILEEALNIIEISKPELKGLLTIFEYFKGHEKSLLNFLLEITRMDASKWDDLYATFIQRWGRAEGEFSTGQQLNELLIRLLDPQVGSFYDGTVGLGGSLLAAGRKNKGLDLYGEDINRTAVKITKLRLFIEGLNNQHIEQADIFTKPSFVQGKHLMQFDYVAMHMPFGLRVHSTEPFDEDEYLRFLYGRVTQTNVDLAFLMHGIASLKENGKGAFLMMGSPLMRSGADMTIRKNLITADLIEAIIALPDKMLTNTSIPIYLVIVNKAKEAEMKNRMMFINARDEYESDRSFNYLRDEHITKIVETYKDKAHIDDYSQVMADSDLEDHILLPEKYIVEKRVEDNNLGSVYIRHNQFKANKQVVPLKDCVDHSYRGLNITASTVKEGGGPLKIIKLSDVENGYLHLDHLTAGELVRDSNLARYRVQEGDLIISNRGTHTKIAVVPAVDDNVILSHSFIGLRLKKDIDPYYLKMYLESPIGQFELAQQQVGSKILSISPTNLQKVNVLLNEDETIGQKYDAIFKEYEAALQAIEEKKRSAIKQLYVQAGIIKYVTIE